jgi:hypothetical protein
LTLYVPCGSISNLSQRFDSLPRELKDKITDFIPGHPLAASCNYLIPQLYWKHIFLQIPFLWDIDREVIEKKALEVDTKGFAWDWEKLTRQLMSALYSEGEFTAWSYEKVGLVVAPGLTNRRRVWQILEEMFPNDVDW